MLRIIYLALILALAASQPNIDCCNITAAGVLLTCKECALDPEFDEYILNAMNISAIDVDAFAFPGANKGSGVHLSGNALTFLPDGVFRSLSSTTIMDLSWNALGALSEKTFEGLSSLTYLILSINRIASVSPLTFRATPALQTLYLDTQFFGNFSPGDGWILHNGTFATNANLTALSLYDEGLRGVEVGAFEGLVGLQSLDLSNGGGGPNLSPPFPDFSGLRALRTLDLSGSLCGGDPPASTLPASFLRGLANLSALTLDGNDCITSLPRELFADQSASLAPAISGTGAEGSCGGGLPPSCKACGVEISKLDASCF